MGPRARVVEARAISAEVVVNKERIERVPSGTAQETEQRRSRLENLPTAAERLGTGERVAYAPAFR